METLARIGLVVGGAALVVPLAWRLMPRSTKRQVVLRALKASCSDKGGPGDPEREDYEKHVLPHGPLRKLADNLWVVAGTLPQPGPSFCRNMVVYRLPGSRELLVHSPVCLAAEARAELEALGEVAWILVPNGFHRLDVAAYAKAYPRARVVCPAQCRPDIDGWATVADTCEAAFVKGSGRGIECLCVNGAGDECPELLYVLDLEGDDAGKALVSCDTLWNLNPATADWFTHKIGAANGFGFTAAGKLLLSDVATCRKWVADELANPDKRDITTILVAHGDVVQGRADVAAALHTCLANLA